MNQYEAPKIKQQESLRVALGGFSRSDLDSDAEIKHRVTPVQAYQAPTITEHSDLDGKLQSYSDVN